MVRIICTNMVCFSVTFVNVLASPMRQSYRSSESLLLSTDQSLVALFRRLFRQLISHCYFPHCSLCHLSTPTWDLLSNLRLQNVAAPSGAHAGAATQGPAVVFAFLVSTSGLLALPRS